MSVVDTENSSLTPSCLPVKSSQLKADVCRVENVERKRKILQLNDLWCTVLITVLERLCCFVSSATAKEYDEKEILSAKKLKAKTLLYGFRQ